MPRKENPFAGYGIGPWLNRSTKGLPVADQTSFLAAQLGIIPGELGMLNQIDAEALSFIKDLEETNSLLATQPHAARIEHLLRNKAQIREEHPGSSQDKRTIAIILQNIDRELNRYPNLKDVVKLLEVRETFAREIYRLRGQALKIYPDLNKDWPPTKFPDPSAKPTGPKKKRK